MPTKEDKKDKAIERKQSKIEDLNVSKHENDELLPK